MVRGAATKTIVPDRLYKEVFDDLDDYALVVTDSYDSIIGWSDGAGKLLGYREQEVIGKPAAMIFCPDDPGVILPCDETVRVALKGKLKQERRCIKKDGSLIWTESTIRRLQTEEPNGGGYIRIIKSIKEKRENKEALRYSQELYSSIFESSVGCVKLLDANACLISMNEPGRCLMEIDDFEMLKGRSWITLWPEEYHDDILKAIDDAKAGGVGHFQGFCPTAKGTPKWWDVVVSPVNDSQNGVRRLISISRDITESKQFENDLVYQRALFEAQNDATPDAILVVSPDNSILYHNRSFLKMWNMPNRITASKDGMAAFDFAAQRTADPEAFLKRVKNLRGHPEEISHQELTLKNGQTIDHYGVPVIGSDGTYFGWAWYFRDITTRKLAETSLQQSERKFRALTEKSYDAVCLVSKQGRVTYTSPSVRQVIGYTPQELIDMDDPFAFIYPDDRARVEQKFEGILQRPGKKFSDEYQYKCKDGQYRWLEVTATNLLHDQAVRAVVANFRNISERKQVEEDLRQQSQLTKNITDNATTALFIMDDRQRCVFMNPAAEIITGLAFSSIQNENKPLHDLIHHKRPDGSPYAMEDCPIDRALPTQAQTQGEDVFVRPDDTLYPVAFTASPIIRDGRPVGTVIEVRDITQQKEIENQIRQLNRDLEKRVEERTEALTSANKELARSNSELEDFAYVASHDLQEPLRKIIAFSGLLASDYEDKLPDEALKYIDGLQKSSGRMRTLINDLLTYSRVTTQAQPFKKVPLGEVVQEVLEDLQTRIEDTKAVITVGDLPTVTGDRLQMRLLLQNLISNALKYGRPHIPPEINIQSGQKGKNFTLVVEDNGIGFNQDYSDKIFTIFQRLHGKNEYEGTGIGLAICKKIAERHGGEIAATSKEGVGSKFIVSLPVSMIAAQKTSPLT